MRFIGLTRNRSAIIDDEDFELVMSVNKRWHCTCNHGFWYAAAYIGTSRQDYTTVCMHRVIMGHPDGDVHHLNGDGLDNRRCNMVALTRRQHSYTKTWPNKTGYKGVSYEPDRRKYVAHIRINGIIRKLGRFDSAKDAALAYENAAKERL